MDQRETDSIIDAARSELKRWGGESPSITHAAFVCARRYSAVFDSVFGPEGRKGVESLLLQQRFRGDEAQLRSILESHDIEGVVAALHTEVKADLVGEEDPTAVAVSAPQVDEPREDDASELSERSARVVEVVEPMSLPSRATEALEIAAHLVREHPPVVALVGDRGVGRSSLLVEVSRVLAGLKCPLTVLRLAPETVIANGPATLRMVVDDLKTDAVVVIDDLDTLARLASDSPDRDFLAAVEASGRHAHARLVVVLDRKMLSRLSIINQALHDDLAVVPINELPAAEIRQIVAARAREMSTARGVSIDDDVIAAALAPAIGTTSLAHPGLALARVDLAIGRATVSESETVTTEHLAGGGSQPAIHAQAASFTEMLTSKVKGQNAAAEKVAQRLTLTRANLDLRPERPNGVFLFVGPTGVGKTELAREIAVHEYGGTDRLIRLDMSEFAQEWAISRLIGPMPGYVGSTEPESWLTTKIAAQPNCVVLLDEIEKAHPRVWNTFLQVFDSGHLTDSRGVTADFSEAVIVMTSNLGVKEAVSRAVGFGGDDAGARDRLMGVVREHMAPELLNRMDEVIVFNALSMEAIVEIAHLEVDAVKGRLSTAGWSLEVGSGVAEWLARTGYDPAYGARHLQRNIERELLALLPAAESRDVHIDVSPDDNLRVKTAQPRTAEGTTRA